MRKSTIVGLALLLFSALPAHAQSQSPSPPRRNPARQSAARSQNYAQQEAIRLLFGPQGLPALTRPSDPWNYQRPRVYYNQPNYNRYPNRVFYR